MSARRFLDTNILIYAFSNDQAKAEVAEAILAAGGSISVQVLNEFANVCHNKLKLGWEEIEERLRVVKTLVGEIAPLTLDVHEKAFQLARHHDFSFYDALIVVAAHSLGCTCLLTEDMQHGRTIGSLTIENPFIEVPNA